MYVHCSNGHSFDPSLTGGICPQCGEHPVQNFDNGGMSGGVQSYGPTEPAVGGWNGGGASDGWNVGGVGREDDWNPGVTEPASAGGWSGGAPDPYAGTMPPDGGWNTPGAGNIQNYGGTLPAGGAQSQYAGQGGLMQDYGATVPANGPGFTMPAGPGQFNPGETRPAMEWMNGGNGQVENYDGRTMPVNQMNSPISSFPGGAGRGMSVNYPGQAFAPAPSSPMYPVVGWLVCTGGKEKGRSYPIHPENNYVGRGERMDICVNDGVISHENQFVIAYVTRTRKFYASSSGGRNITELNDIPLSNTVEIHAYDRFTVGTATFMFIPFCGEQFGWDDVEND